MVYYRILDLERYLNEPSMTMIQLSPHNNYIIRGNTAIKKLDSSMYKCMLHGQCGKNS